MDRIISRKTRYGRIFLYSIATLVAVFPVVASGCETSRDTTVEESERPEGWTEETHSNDVDPNYDIVFPEDKVNTIKITVSPENWESMQENMTELYGQAGTGTGDLPGQNLVPPQEALPEGNDFIPPDNEGFIPRNDEGFVPPDGEDFAPPDDALLPKNKDFLAAQDRLIPGSDNGTLPIRPDADQQADQVPNWVNMASENPEWVTATIEFDGLTWTDVGFRFKGNSSLTRSWREGTIKLPFKLDFDEFEDDYPAIDDQRFYGFKQLSFSNAFNDATYMHDALASDLLQDSGLPASETAWYEVILDYGEGEVSLGLYVLTEVIDDTAIEHYFGDDSGNIYEGDGRGVSLAENTYTQIRSSFQKENNEDDTDWSDIEELYNVLHSDTRTDDPEKWRKELESIFDVHAFLEWLAISAVVQHWDTYGSMTHNFYLYNDPETDQLTWISWDHNEILSGGRAIGARGDRPVAGIAAGRTLSLARDEVTAEWPLIRYLLDDPQYNDTYIAYMSEFVENVFTPQALVRSIDETRELLLPYIAESERNAFISSIRVMKNQIIQRYEATQDFLATEDE